MSTTKKKYNKNFNVQNNDSRFETFDGYCHVLDDKILRIEGSDMAPEKAVQISNLQRIKIYTFITTAFLSTAYSVIEFLNTNVLLSALYLLFATLFAILVKWQMSRSRVLVIPNESIVSARFYGARFGRKRSFFEIAYSKNFLVWYIKIFLSPSEDADNHNTNRALHLMEHLLDSDDFFTKI